jgi:hypothetical protein
MPLIKNMKNPIKISLGAAAESLRESRLVPAATAADILGTGGQPRRIQLSRKRGWRKPGNTTVVSRPSKWGNPFRVSDTYPVEQAVAAYEHWLMTNPAGIATLLAAKIELRGKILACWCKPGTPCHGDVLLRLVNEKF